jgi:hypothetical protein
MGMLAKEGLMSCRTSSTESGRAFERVRRSLLSAAFTTECSPRRLSFCAALQFLANTWLLAATNRRDLRPLLQLRLTYLASHAVGNRPHRIEPRAIKRRPKPHNWLTNPRPTARAELLTGYSP